MTKFWSDSSSGAFWFPPGAGEIRNGKRATEPLPERHPKGCHPHRGIGKLLPVKQGADRVCPRPQVVPVPQQAETIVGIPTAVLGIRAGRAVAGPVGDAVKFNGDVLGLTRPARDGSDPRSGPTPTTGFPKMASTPDTRLYPPPVFGCPAVMTKFWRDSSQRTTVVSPEVGKSGRSKPATPAPREGVFPKGRHAHSRIGELHPVNQRPDRMRPGPEVVPVPQQTEAGVAMSTDTLYRRLSLRP